MLVKGRRTKSVREVSGTYEISVIANQIQPGGILQCEKLSSKIVLGLAKALSLTAVRAKTNIIILLHLIAIH
jgi:hypothetical protein